MDIEEVVFKRRSIRRFKQNPIPIEILKKLIDYGRVAPMGGNVQCIEYIIITDPNIRDKFFPLVSWAASLPEIERIPEVGRRPTAYIVVLMNTQIKKGGEADVGAAVENILLGAVNYGLGACWMGSINRDKIRELFKISEYYQVAYVISLGYPDEISVMERYTDSFKYWKDKAGLMHIPKRDLDDIVYKIF